MIRFYFRFYSSLKFENLGKRKIDFTKNRIQTGNCELEYFAERIRCPPPPHFHEFLVERNNCQAASINRQREFIFSLISSVRSDQLMRGPRTCYECPHTLAASNYYSNARSLHSWKTRMSYGFRQQTQ